MRCLDSRKPTWPKVDGGVEALYRAALEVSEPSSVRGKEHHLLAEVRPEQRRQVAHVVVVAGGITAVFILHLPNAAKSHWGMIVFLLMESCSVMKSIAGETHLYSDYRTPILVKKRLHHWQQLPHPLIYRCDVIWHKENRHRFVLQRVTMVTCHHSTGFFFNPHLHRRTAAQCPSS